jgi:hypothetical protein
MKPCKISKRKSITHPKEKRKEQPKRDIERERENQHPTRGMSQYGFAIYIKKYLKAKEELWKFKYFTIQKYINLKKKSSKRNQNPSRYIITL